MDSLKPSILPPVRGGTWVEKKHFDSLCAFIIDGAAGPEMPVCVFECMTADQTPDVISLNRPPSHSGFVVVCLLARPWAGGSASGVGQKGPGMNGHDVGGWLCLRTWHQYI